MYLDPQAACINLPQREMHLDPQAACLNLSQREMHLDSQVACLNLSQCEMYLDPQAACLNCLSVRCTYICRQRAEYLLRGALLPQHTAHYN